MILDEIFVIDKSWRRKTTKRRKVVVVIIVESKSKEWCQSSRNGSKAPQKTELLQLKLIKLLLIRKIKTEIISMKVPQDASKGKQITISLCCPHEFVYFSFYIHTRQVLYYWKIKQNIIMSTKREEIVTKNTSWVSLSTFTLSSNKKPSDIV